MHASDSDSDSDESSSNVIYIKNNRKKKEKNVSEYVSPPHNNFQTNPFFNPMFSIGHRNFQ